MATLVLRENGLSCGFENSERLAFPNTVAAVGKRVGRQASGSSVRLDATGYHEESGTLTIL